RSADSAMASTNSSRDNTLVIVVLFFKLVRRHSYAMCPNSSRHTIRPALNLTLDEQQQSLAGWAKHCIKEDKISRIIDPCLKGQVSVNYLKESRKIAYECLLTSLKDRPIMTNVLSRLELVLAWTLRSPQSANDQKGNGITTLLKRHDHFSRLKLQGEQELRCSIIPRDLFVETYKIKEDVYSHVLFFVDRNAMRYGDKVKLKSSSWKEVIRFGKRGKLNPSKVHSTFHVSNLKKCLSDESLVIPLDEIQIDNKLHFVDEPIEILDREVKQLKQSHISIVKISRDTIQLETAVTTISHEYLLEFTSEYGISEALHSVLFGPEDRIVVFLKGKQEAGEKYHSMLNQFIRFPKKLEQPLLLGGREGILDYCGLAHKCSEGWDASREYLFPGGCDDTEHTSHPNRKTTRSTTLLSRVEPQILPGRRDMDLFSLIHAPNPTKVKTGTRPRAAYEVPLLTVTASRVIQIEDPAAGTDSSRNVTTTGVAPEIGQAKGIAATGPHLVKERRKRGNDGVDTNAPPKVLRRDHVDPRPTESTRGRKSLTAIELGMGSTHPVPASQGVPMDMNDLDLLSFTDPQSRPSADVTQSSNRAATAKDPTSENTSFTSMASGDGVAAAVENLETLLEAESDMKKAAKGRSIELSKELENMRALFLDLQVKQRCAEIDARLDALSIDFDEELYLHMLTMITGRRWEIRHGLHLAVIKCGESTKLRQAFADIVSVGIAKGMSEGRKNGVKHRKANLSLEAIEAYDPKAEAKYITALHALKDLKYPILDQLGSLKDAQMDVIMAFLHLKSDTGDDALQLIRELHPSSSQLSILVYPEARDPTDP
nr:putative reverse transcriptase domain-containing protein [Tanacetum cinerariifolium]